ncbi:hypothetical protein D3C85_861940 [compost metagenome]
MPIVGTLPLTASGSSVCLSALNQPRPATDSTVAEPGIRNETVTWSCERMLVSVQATLLPGRSGITSVFLSSASTKPSGSPRGDSSVAPSAFRVSIST